MLEIISDVLNAEEDAETRITHAREDIQHQLANLEQEEHAREQKVREEQNERVRSEIARIRKEADESLRIREQEARDRADRFLEEAKPQLLDLAESVRSLVLESPLFND